MFVPYASEIEKNRMGQTTRNFKLFDKKPGFFLAGKTHREHFVSCCLFLLCINCYLLLLSVVKKGNNLALSSTCFDGFQPKLVIYASWEPLFVDGVKGHISR